MTKVTDLKIAHESFISLHVQLHNQLRQHILSGEWAHGSKIPSESQMARHLNISRSTVRTALQQAQMEGLIERQPGRGTFITYHSNVQALQFIAIITSSFDSESHSLWLNGAEEEAKAQGYRMIFCNTQTSQEEFDTLRQLQAAHVRGVLMWPKLDETHHTRNYADITLPIVMLDRYPVATAFDCVTSDNQGGVKQLMEHLFELGHERIVFLSHANLNIQPVAERLSTYRTIMKAAGCATFEPWLLRQDTGQEINSYDVMRAYSADKHPDVEQIIAYYEASTPRPTAILALNDYLAALAARAMQRLQIPVPEGVSITGFDDTDIAVYLAPPLTTVAQDTYEMGKHAARLLIERMNGHNGPQRSVQVPTQLRIRRSTQTPSAIH